MLYSIIFVAPRRRCVENGTTRHFNHIFAQCFNVCICIFLLGGLVIINWVHKMTLPFFLFVLQEINFILDLHCELHFWYATEIVHLSQMWWSVNAGSNQTLKHYFLHPQKRRWVSLRKKLSMRGKKPDNKELAACVDLTLWYDTICCFFFSILNLYTHTKATADAYGSVSFQSSLGLPTSRLIRPSPR